MKKFVLISTVLTLAGALFAQTNAPAPATPAHPKLHMPTPEQTAQIQHFYQIQLEVLSKDPKLQEVWASMPANRQLIVMTSLQQFLTAVHPVFTNTALPPQEFNQKLKAALATYVQPLSGFDANQIRVAKEMAQSILAVEMEMQKAKKK
jgi:hypothetical protein